MTMGNGESPEATLVRVGTPLPSASGGLWAYVEVMKPRETSLLAFAGMCATIIASDGYPSLGLLLTSLVAVTLGSAGANGLTNYYDRDLDARMARTCRRPIPSRRIVPAERMLPAAIGLIVVGLALAYAMHPYAFIAGAVGVVTSAIGRRRALTHLMGGLFGTAPLLVGWLGARPTLEPTVLLLALLIVCWVPVHVWSVMVAYWDDYQQAGVRMFPLWAGKATATKLMVVGSVATYGVSLAVYVAGGFGWLYLGVANLLGLLMIYASLRLLADITSRAAWRLYKVSAYPYLGLLFMALCADLWLRLWLT